MVKSFIKGSAKNEIKEILTVRELEILEHLAKGKRYKNIAASLLIEIETV